MEQYKAFILLTLATTILINCISPQNSFLPNSKQKFMNSINETKDTIYIYESDYKVVFSKSDMIKIVIINKTLFNKLSNRIDPTLVLHIKNKSYTAKGVEIFSSELPHDCEYFFPLKKKKILFSENNTLELRKVIPKEYNY